jgi:hypothetical protein
MFTVLLRSEEYGEERFEYDTEEERQAGVMRLVRTAREAADRDGIRREVVLVVGADAEEGDEGDE